MKKMICLTIGAFLLSMCLCLAANGADSKVMRSPSAVSPPAQPAVVSALPAPGMGLAPEYSSNQVTISWTYSSSIAIAGFKIERKVGDGSYGNPVPVSSAARFYVETPPSTSSVLTYRLRAYKVVSGKEYYSPYSAEMSVTPTGTAPKRYKMK